MKNLILPILIALFLSACAPSTLTVNPDEELVLEHDSKSYVFSNKVEESKLLSFVYIDVEQKRVVTPSGEVLFYENFLVDHEYEFKYGSIATLKFIFDVNKTNIIYKTGNLLLIQLKINDNEYINLMAETSGIQVLSYVYGFSNKELLAITKELKIDDYKMKDVVPLKNILTDWTQQGLILQPLIEPLFGSRRF